MLCPQCLSLGLHNNVYTEWEPMTHSYEPLRCRVCRWRENPARAPGPTEGGQKYKHEPKARGVRL